MHISIDVPDPEVFDFDKVYDALSYRNIIDLVQRSLSFEHGLSGPVSRSWKTIIEPELRAGKKLQLAWRFGGQLDWEWQERDVEENTRPWAILSGLSLRQVQFARSTCFACVLIGALGSEISSPRVTHRRTLSG